MKLTIEISDQTADYLRAFAQELGPPLATLEGVAAHLVERAARQARAAAAAQQLQAQLDAQQVDARNRV